MFCPKCGEEVVDDAVICVHCGRELKLENKENDENKTSMGVLLGIFAGIVGLIIGICLYPEGSVARKTFMKGWVISFFSALAIYLILVAVIIIVAAACIPPIAY